MTDLSNCLARIQVMYKSLPPSDRQRVHAWCERVIEREGKLEDLQILTRTTGPQHYWHNLRFLLPNEALPVLEQHLMKLSGEQLDLFSMSGGHGRQEKS